MNLSLTPTTDAAALARLLQEDVEALETLLLDLFEGETIKEHLTDADLDRLDRQLRRVLLRVSHLAEAREEGR